MGEVVLVRDDDPAFLFGKPGGGEESYVLFYHRREAGKLLF